MFVRSLAPILLFWAVSATGASAGGLVGEYWGTEDAMPDLWGTAVGTTKSITFVVDRDMSRVGGAALELVVDDIDAKAEAGITCNGQKVEVVEGLLGEGKGFRGRIEVPVSAVKGGENVVAFTFASTVGGTTTGYAIMEAHLVLMVPEGEADSGRMRDYVPDLAEEHNAGAYPGRLTGYTSPAAGEVVEERTLASSRWRIGERGLYMTAIARLDGGVLIACSNYRFEGTTWRIKVLRSRDEGATWEQVKTGGAALAGREPRLSALGDGGLLLTTWADNRLRVYRSGDGGETWSVTELDDGVRACRNVIAREDGTLMIFAARGAYFDLSAPASKAWVYESRDGGATWTRGEELAVWQNPEPVFEEGSVVRSKGGRLVAAGRVSGNVRVPGVALTGTAAAPLPWMHGSSISPGDESGDHMIIAESADGGKTWDAPRTLTGYSRVHGHLLALSDGRLVCTYAQRHLPFGIYAMVSGDGGRTWEKEVVRLAVSQNAFVGWPMSVEMEDGSILTAYGTTAYLEHEDAVGTLDRVAEVVRWKAPPR